MPHEQRITHLFWYFYSSFYSVVQYFQIQNKSCSVSNHLSNKMLYLKIRGSKMDVALLVGLLALGSELEDSVWSRGAPQSSIAVSLPSLGLSQRQRFGNHMHLLFYSLEAKTLWNGALLWGHLLKIAIGNRRDRVGADYPMQVLAPVAWPSVSCSHTCVSQQHGTVMERCWDLLCANEGGFCHPGVGFA